MSFDVAIVTYHSRGEIERCLESILAQAPPDSVTVVDNASTDGTPDLIAQRFPQVRVIASRRNAGFGAGCNQAIRATGGDYVILVNPDCELQAGAFDALIAFMADHPRAAVAGGRLRYADGAFQHAAFRFPTLAQIGLDFFP